MVQKRPELGSGEEEASEQAECRIQGAECPGAPRGILSSREWVGSVALRLSGGPRQGTRAERGRREGVWGDARRPLPATFACPC